MWKEIKNTCYHLSFNKPRNYTILVTDYLRIWYVYFTRSTLIQCLKESNTILLQIKDDVILEKAFHILSNPSEVKSASIMLDNSILSITLTKHFGYNFKVIMKLEEGSKELFFQKITQPILQTVQELQSDQAELCDLLIKKDKEIKKLRETGQTHSHETTSLFKADVFLATHSKVKDYFGSEQIPSSILEKTVIPPDDLKDVKEENGDNEIEFKVKAEPVTQIKHETENVVTFTLNENIKDECHQAVKREIPSSPKPRKKVKKLNL